MSVDYDTLSDWEGSVTFSSLSLLTRIAQVRGWAEDMGLPLDPAFPVLVDEGECYSIDIDQGSVEWHLLRLGIPTASTSRIMTKKKHEYAAGAKGYIAELMAETMLGQPLDSGATTDFMVRGTEMEPEARNWYELTRGVEVRQTGFLMSYDGTEGGSPDGLVGDEGGLEIKCYGAKHHMEHLLGLDEGAVDPQVQALMRLTGRKWFDVVAYNPKLPCRIQRVYRDDKYLAKLDACMVIFKAERAKVEARLLEIGSVRIDDSAVEDDGADALVAEMYPQIEVPA